MNLRGDQGDQIMLVQVQPKIDDMPIIIGRKDGPLRFSIRKMRKAKIMETLARIVPEQVYST